MKVLLLGLDGATFELILPWARDGKLPNIASILDSSCFGELESLPPITPAGWTSIMTGVNCGKHGLADFLKLNRNTYQMVPSSRLDRKVDTVYNILGRNGLRCIVLGYPMTYPAEEINGYIVTGMQTPVKDDRCTYPPGIIHRLEKEMGEVMFMAGHTEGQERGDFLASVKRLTDSTERMILHFLARDDFDLMAAVFMAPDIVSHAFWKHMDHTHPHRSNTPPEELERFEGAIEDVYRQVDGSIGRIVEALKGTDTVIVMVSDHGSGPLHGYVNINKLLVEMEFMTLVEGRSPKERSKILRAITGLLRGRGRAVRGGTAGDRKGYFSDVDWEATSAYSWGNLCSISLNVSGREGLGTVDPDEAGEFKKKLAARLRELRAPDGKRLVDEVGIREDVFHGPHVNELPDMFMIMRNISYLGRGLNPLYRDIRSRPLVEPADISGTHRVEGIYAISDLCTRKRFVRHAGKLEMNGRKYRVHDIAPTLLFLSGQNIPGGLDGEAMLEAFTDTTAPGKGRNTADGDGDK